MKYQELKEKIINGEDIFIKKYLPLVQKKYITESISAECISKDEIYYIDKFALDINFTITVLLNYCELETSEEDNMMEIYDFVVENRVLIDEYINNQKIPSDVWDLEDYINSEIERQINKLNTIEQNENKIENIVANFLNKLIEIAEKLPNEQNIKAFLNKVPEVMNNISPENKQYIQQILNYDYSNKKTTTPRKKKNT